MIKFLSDENRVLQCMELVLEELLLARDEHPEFPNDDIVHAVAIMAEEAGEAVKAANDIKWASGTVEDLRTELAHTAAVCVRILVGLEQ